jgi:pilus assembly protein CpaB
MAGIAVPSGSRARSNRLILIAALAFGVLTAALVVAYLRDKEEEQRTLSTASVPVVVARREIPLGATITADMVELRHVTPDAAVAAAFDKVDVVTGLRARYVIPAGAQIVPGLVVKAGAADALSFVVPPGKRAVTIAASEVIGGGGHIRPGDFVDVLARVEVVQLTGATPAAGVGNEKPKGVVTILQNVEVLAVAQETEKVAGAGPHAKNDRDGDTRKPSDIKSIVLAVTPEQAQVLLLFESKDNLRLALRPFGERDEAPLAPVTEPLLVPGAPATPVPRTPTPAPPSR